MTIAELIEKLRSIQSDFGPDLPVMVKGFDEGGYDDIGTFEMVRVVKVREVSGHCPMYDEPSDWMREQPLGPEFDALSINF